MKIKSGFLLRSIAGTQIVVPTGSRCREFNGMITLNDTAAFIWKKLEEGLGEDGIFKAILDVYVDVDEPGARKCVRHVITKLREAGCIED